MSCSRTFNEDHNLENRLRTELERVDPDNPALKMSYVSTFQAIDSYLTALAKRGVNK